MNQVEASNGNALIAEFMGREVKHISGHVQYIWCYKKRIFKKDAVRPLNVLTMPMLVVIKINKTNGKFNGLCKPLIDCLWLCVVEFIKWYNEKIKA